MKNVAKCDKAKGIKRSTLACLSCRSVRQKCNGVPPEGLLDQHAVDLAWGSPVKSLQPCKRCVLNQHECLWNQSRRFGRPRKAQRIVGVQAGQASPPYPGSTIQIDSSDSSASHTAISADSNSSLSPTDRKTSSLMYGAQNLIPDENLINLSDVLSLMQTDVSTLPGFEQGQILFDNSSSMTLDENTWFPIVDYNSIPSHKEVATHETNEHTSPNSIPLPSMAASTSSSSFSSLDIPGEGIGEGHSDKLDKAVLQGFQWYTDLSLEPPPMISGGTTQIQRVILETSEIKSLGEKSLYLAMAAAGYRMAREDLGIADALFEDSSTRIQRYLSNSGRNGSDITSAVDAMYTIQACSVLAPYAYGTRNIVRAQELLLGAAQLAICRGLHQLDSPEFSNDHLSFRMQIVELKTKLGERTGCSCRQFESCAACFAEALRQTWWEVSAEEYLLKRSSNEFNMLGCKALYM